MKIRRIYLTLIFCLSIFFACSRQDRPPPLRDHEGNLAKTSFIESQFTEQESKMFMQGGDFASASQAQALSSVLTIFFFNENDTTDYMRCTVVRVSTDHFLTAGHCLGSNASRKTATYIRDSLGSEFYKNSLNLDILDFNYPILSKLAGKDYAVFKFSKNNTGILDFVEELDKRVSIAKIAESFSKDQSAWVTAFGTIDESGTQHPTGEPFKYNKAKYLFDLTTSYSGISYTSSDAKIRGGDSGSPMFDAAGRLVGIVSQAYGVTGDNRITDGSAFVFQHLTKGSVADAVKSVINNYTPDRFSHDVTKTSTVTKKMCEKINANPKNSNDHQRFILEKNSRVSSISGQWCGTSVADKFVDYRGDFDYDSYTHTEGVNRTYTFRENYMALIYQREDNYGSPVGDWTFLSKNSLFAQNSNAEGIRIRANSSEPLRHGTITVCFEYDDTAYYTENVEIVREPTLQLGNPLASGKDVKKEEIGKELGFDLPPPLFNHASNNFGKVPHSVLSNDLIRLMLIDQGAGVEWAFNSPTNLEYNSSNTSKKIEFYTDFGRTGDRVTFSWNTLVTNLDDLDPGIANPSNPLPSLENKFSSFTISSNTEVIVCDGLNLTSRCMILDETVPDLNVYDFNDKVSSFAFCEGTNHCRTIYSCSDLLPNESECIDFDPTFPNPNLVASYKARYDQGVSIGTMWKELTIERMLREIKASAFYSPTQQEMEAAFELYDNGYSDGDTKMGLQVYHNFSPIEGRPPTLDELHYWIRMVKSEVVNYRELNRAIAIKNVFDNKLGRSPSEDEMKFWINKARSEGISINDLEKSIITFYVLPIIINSVILH